MKPFTLVRWMNGVPAYDRNDTMFRYVGSLKYRDTIYKHIGESHEGYITQFDAIGGNSSNNYLRSLISMDD